MKVRKLKNGMTRYTFKDGIMVDIMPNPWFDNLPPGPPITFSYTTLDDYNNEKIES